MLRSLAVLAVLAFLCLGADCHLRGPTPAEVQHDSAWGAAIAAMFGGPAAAPIGAAIAVLLGVAVRSTEKGRIIEKHAEEKVQLTENFAKRLEGIATTQTYRASEALAKNAPPPAPPTQEPPP